MDGYYNNLNKFQTPYSEKTNKQQIKKYRHFFWVTCFKNNQQKNPPEI
jgi:hypothetical protein